MNKYEINYESYVMIDGYRCFEEFDSNILNSIYFSYLSNYFKYNWQVISSFNIGTTLNDYDKFLPYNLLLSKNKAIYYQASNILFRH